MGILDALQVGEPVTLLTICLLMDYYQSIPLKQRFPIGLFTFRRSREALLSSKGGGFLKAALH